MDATMRETAVPPTLTEHAGEPEFHASVRERLGIAAFVAFAALASAAWVALLVWGVVKVASSF